jgi:hypothetical protein
MSILELLEPEQLKTETSKRLQELLEITKSNERILLRAINERIPKVWNVYYNLYEKKHSNKTSCFCNSHEEDEDEAYSEDDTDGWWIDEKILRGIDGRVDEKIEGTKYFVKKYYKNVRMYIPKEYIKDGFVVDDYLFEFDIIQQVCNCPEEEYSRISMAFLASITTTGQFCDE